MPKEALPEMKNRGVDSLTRMDDREIVESASKSKGGEKFSQLYNGFSIIGSEEKDEKSLMTRIAMFVNGDKEQLIRIFQSSKQFREGKGMGYYEMMAERSLGFIAEIKGTVAAKGLPIAKTPKTGFGKTAKA